MRERSKPHDDAAAAFGVRLHRFARRSSARCATGSARRNWRPDDRREEDDRDRRPPEQVWKVIMDPARYRDWVTIHRKISSVDDGRVHKASGLSSASPCATRRSRCTGR
jgi:hypothetical protein